MRHRSLHTPRIATAALLAALSGCGSELATVDEEPNVPGSNHASPSAAPTEDDAPEPVALLVAFTPGSTTSEREAALSDVGLRVEPRRSGSSHFVRVTPSASHGIRSAARLLARDPRVRVVEPDLPLRAAGIPNDPGFIDRWELHNVGQYAGSTADADIDAPEAWDINDDCRSVPVAVLDSGVSYADDDLADNIMRTSDGQLVGYDFVEDDDDPSDPTGHGTGVASFLGQVGNNGVGSSGVCQRASIIPLRVLAGGTTSGLIAALDYARTHGARIINMSFSMGARFSQLTFEALLRAQADGILVVVAAGNDGRNSDVSPWYPGSYNQVLDNVISVGATTWEDSVAGYSRHGLSVDIMAPSTNGTSFAAPLVAGAAALVAATYPASADYRTLKRRILAGVDHPVTTIGRVRSGRLNLGRSMQNDGVAPGAPTGLRITQRSSTELALAWWASGDDGASGGAAAAYELRYATQPIDPETFDRATEVVHAMIPAAPGSPERHVLTGLAPHTTYYVALRAVDKVGNLSPIVSLPYGIRTAPTTTLLFDGAESGAPAFAGTGLWTASSEEAATGARAYSDSPGAPAPSNSESALTQIVPVTLTGEMPMLQFRAKLDLGLQGSLQVELSRDGGAIWEDIRYPLTGQDLWRTHRIMLHAFKNASVLVRFRLSMYANSDNFDGVWLDDIQITSAPGASCQLDDDAEGAQAFQGTSWAVSSEDSFSPGHAYSSHIGGSYPRRTTTTLVQSSPLLLDRSDPWLASAAKTGLLQNEQLTVQASLDGGAVWSPFISAERASDYIHMWGSMPWSYRTTSLAPFRNQSFKLRWELRSDVAGGDERGAWVDDIAICSEPFQSIAQPPPLPPAATQLQAVLMAANQAISVRWVDAAKGETGYRVQRRTPGSAWVDLQQLPPSPGAGSTVSYTDGGLNPGTYEYRVLTEGSWGATVTGPVTTTLGCSTCE